MLEQGINPPPVTYLVGPNGTGKTRYLLVTISTEEGARFVPNKRQERGLGAEFAGSEKMISTNCRCPNLKLDLIVNHLPVSLDGLLEKNFGENSNC